MDGKTMSSLSPEIDDVGDHNRKKPVNTVKIGDWPPYIRDFIERGARIAIIL
jgi:hypothetical protein